MGFAKKVLVFSPPFEGHLSVIRRLVLDNSDIDWRVIITGWNNIPPKLDGIERVATVIAHTDLAETDPALWTFPRVVELLDDCLEIAAEFGPDLIIYDFFSIEGYFVGKLRDIPRWSSIPAFIGKYSQQSYLESKLKGAANQRALEALTVRYGIHITPDDLEMISDGIHIPGDVNLIWSYEAIVTPDFRNGRHDTPFLFIGNPSQHSEPAVRQGNSPPIIYISFGTVVMNNIWNQQAQSRDSMREFISRLAELWANEPLQVIFVTQGKQILDHYPDNWRIEQNVNQVDLLRTSDVFVTHAGSNSFHESLVAGTPMVAIPFFGDQPLVASTIERLGVGINLVPEASIDTHSARTYIGRELADKLDVAVHRLLVRPPSSLSTRGITLVHAHIRDVLHGKVTFEEGDLLFGTNVDRKHYVDDNNLQDEFTILEFKAFSEIAPKKSSLPRIVDIYHDVILNAGYYALDMAAGMDTYAQHLMEYKQYLAGETDFEKMCIKGIDFFTRFYHIHFILNEYDPAINIITRAEIDYILNNRKRLKDRVTFYRLVNGVWIPCSITELMKTYNAQS